MDYARFYGDFPQHISKEQLYCLKRIRSVQVLLATAQSSGTGLNLVEANHVVLCDR